MEKSVQFHTEFSKFGPVLVHHSTLKPGHMALVGQVMSPSRHPEKEPTSKSGVGRKSGRELEKLKTSKNFPPKFGPSKSQESKGQGTEDPSGRQEHHIISSHTHHALPISYSTRQVEGLSLTATDSGGCSGDSRVAQVPARNHGSNQVPTSLVAPAAP